MLPLSVLYKIRILKLGKHNKKMRVRSTPIMAECSALDSTVYNMLRRSRDIIYIGLGGWCEGGDPHK
jgi:hypothetical protein